MDQQAESLLIMPLEQVQRLLKVGDKINAVFYMTDSPTTHLAGTPVFIPKLEDLGIVTEYHNGKWYIKSARMLFNDEQVEAIENSLSAKNAEVGLLYLATSIRAVKNNRETPYSTVYATGGQYRHSRESGNLDERLSSLDSRLRGNDELDEIALSEWCANDLAVQIGDEIELTWFDPDNVSITHSKIFTLAKILPDNHDDKYLVPTVEGFTDEVSIADWDPPFPFDAKKIRKKDEDYWDEYRAAPKAFVSLATGQELFGSRFGKVTTIVVEDGRQQTADGSREPATASLVAYTVEYGVSRLFLTARIDVAK
jgi:hypothetical protein